MHLVVRVMFGHSRRSFHKVEPRDETSSFIIIGLKVQPSHIDLHISMVLLIVILSLL